MPNHDPLAIYGLAYDPFVAQLPVEHLWRPEGLDSLLLRLRLLLRTGGFALISGEPGMGKSKLLHLLADWLGEHDDLVVGVMERPQSTTSDFYRELGDIFGVSLSPANRYGGFKALRERFRRHIKTTLHRPVLLLDEAQEACTATLTELRLLCSARFDSELLLTVVMCGDDRLPERFRHRELISLGSRMRVRHLLKPIEPKALLDFLDHSLTSAGAPHLMSDGLRRALVEHCAGNLRILAAMANDVLAYGAQHDIAELDDDAFLKVFHSSLPSTLPRRKGARR